MRGVPVAVLWPESSAARQPGSPAARRQEAGRQEQEPRAARKLASSQARELGPEPKLPLALTKRAEAHGWVVRAAGWGSAAVRSRAARQRVASGSGSVPPCSMRRAPARAESRELDACGAAPEAGSRREAWTRPGQPAISPPRTAFCAIAGSMSAVSLISVIGTALARSACCLVRRACEDDRYAGVFCTTCGMRGLCPLASGSRYSPCLPAHRGRTRASSRGDSDFSAVRALRTIH